MPNSLALLFPGQGSQAVGMGKDLCAEFDIARQTFAEADDTLSFALTSLCFEGPADTLTLTENTQPALVTLSTALYRVLSQEFDLPVAVAAGHSLGEFSALVATGSLSFPDALKVVRERGRAMQEAVAPGVGAMAAILGLNSDQIDDVCQKVAGDEVVSAANYNGGGQIVVAGHAAAVSRAIEEAQARGAKRAVPLKVSAPFHCALMKPAQDRLAQVLEEINVSPFTFPVISNVEATTNEDPSRVKELLARQVTAPVRWEESMGRLKEVACEWAVEVGPGRVLSGLLRRIEASIKSVSGEKLDSISEMVSQGA